MRRGTWTWWFFRGRDGGIRRGREGAEGKGRSQGIFVGSRWNEGNRVVRQGVWGSVEATGVELQVVEEEKEGEELFQLH